MRLVVTSDTHLPRGARRLPEPCLREFERADLILHAGDFVSAAVLDDLRSFAPVEAVHGNMDDAELRMLLPERRVVEVEGMRIGMLHDAGARVGREARLAAAFPGCDAMVYGHTHIPQVERHADIWVLNPGSPTERRRAPHRAFVVAEVDGGKLTPQLVVLP